MSEDGLQAGGGVCYWRRAMHDFDGGREEASLASRRRFIAITWQGSPS
jgi:hypothetical protein